MVKIPDAYNGYTYETKKYFGDTLTEEVQELVKNRIEIKAPKQINGWERFTNKASKAISEAPRTPNVDAALEELSKPANYNVPRP